MNKNIDKYFKEYKKNFKEEIERRTRNLEQIKIATKELKIYNNEYRQLLKSIQPMISEKNYNATLSLGKKLEQDIKEIKNPDYKILKKIIKEYGKIFIQIPPEKTREYFGDLEKKTKNSQQ